jgi:LDH2 family malate/lactate/ureidoglycolate dehydrogenase
VVDFNADHVTLTNTGQSILVIDLNAFGDPAVFKQSVDQLVRDIRNSERMPGVERIWLPGEQSHEKRVRYEKGGIPLPNVLVDELQALAHELGVSPLVTMA